jgi:hypothetical protein
MPSEIRKEISESSMSLKLRRHHQMLVKEHKFSPILSIQSLGFFHMSVSAADDPAVSVTMMPHDMYKYSACNGYWNVLAQI